MYAQCIFSMQLNLRISLGSLPLVPRKVLRALEDIKMVKHVKEYDAMELKV